MSTEKKRKAHAKDLKEASDNKAAAAEKAWKKGFQTTMEKDILDAGRK